MTRAVHKSNDPSPVNLQPSAFRLGTIEKVAKNERLRLYGPDPEPVEIQITRYQASEEARRVVADAFEMADLIRAEAQRSGYDAGWAEGYAIGKSAAETAVHEEADRYRAEYHADFEQIVNRLVDDSRGLWLNAEPEIVAFVLQIARKVVKHEAAVNPDVVTEVVRNSLRRVVDSENVRIRVNAADLDTIRNARSDIMMIIDGVRNVEIIEDRRVSQGGCVVETASGTIDSSIETQFRSIEEALHVVREEIVAELRSCAAQEFDSGGVEELQSSGDEESGSDGVEESGSGGVGEFESGELAA